MVFGLFNKEKALQKTIDRANNVVGQSADRWAAMEKLRDIGSEEALFGLCKRFSFTYDKTIEDQQEKDWTVASLTSLGEPALGPLRKYMKGAQSLGYPLKILGKITTEEKIFEAIDAILEDEEPGYVRNPKRRIDIIEWLGEWTADPKDIVARVIPYIEDFDENVRFKSIEAISLRPHESAAETMCRAMVNKEEESKRFQVRCAEILAEHEWSIESQKDEIAAMLPTILSRFRLEGNLLKTA